jgi:hypothetical protein
MRGGERRGVEGRKEKLCKSSTGHCFSRPGIVFAGGGGVHNCPFILDWT